MCPGHTSCPGPCRDLGSLASLVTGMHLSHQRATPAHLPAFLAHFCLVLTEGVRRLGAPQGYRSWPGEHSEWDVGKASTAHGMRVSIFMVKRSFDSLEGYVMELLPGQGPSVCHLGVRLGSDGNSSVWAQTTVSPTSRRPFQDRTFPVGGEQVCRNHPVVPWGLGQEPCLSLTVSWLCCEWELHRKPRPAVSRIRLRGTCIQVGSPWAAPSPRG